MPNYKIKIKNNIEFKKIAIIKKEDEKYLVTLGFNYVSLKFELIFFDIKFNFKK